MSFVRGLIRPRMVLNFLKRSQGKMGKPRSSVELKKSNYIIRLFSGLSIMNSRAMKDDKKSRTSFSFNQSNFRCRLIVRSSFCIEQVAKSTAIELSFHSSIHSLSDHAKIATTTKQNQTVTITYQPQQRVETIYSTHRNKSRHPLRGYDRGKRILFTDDEFLMLVGDVALDLALVDEIGEETFALFGVDVFFRQDGPQRRHEGGNRQLRHGQDEIDFLEEVPHRDGLEFLQDQVDAAFDEEGLVLDERLIQAPQVARFNAARYFRKRRQIVLFKQRQFGHLTWRRGREGRGREGEGKGEPTYHWTGVRSQKGKSVCTAANNSIINNIKKDNGGPKMMLIIIIQESVL